MPGTGTQSSCWGLPLFASIFENRKQISKLVGRDCAGVGWTLELLRAATSGSGVASFTFLLGTELAALPGLTSYFGMGKSPAAAQVWLVAHTRSACKCLTPKLTFTELKSKRVTLPLGFSIWRLTD